MKYIQFYQRDSLLCTSGLLLSGSSRKSEELLDEISWKGDGNGFLQLRTSDERLCESSAWLAFNETLESSLSSVTIETRQVAGSHYSGFGPTFCYQDSNNFYCCLICATGQFSVHKCIAGIWGTIIPWTATPSSNLKAGNDAVNTIAVIAKGEHHFQVLFNGTLETTFEDEALAGGKCGFFASIGDQSKESFPEIPEDIRFRLEKPVRVP